MQHRTLALVLSIAACKSLPGLSSRSPSGTPAIGGGGEAASQEPTVSSKPGDPTGIPAILVQRIKHDYEGQPENEANNYDMLRPALQSFDAPWKAYLARKAVVDPVIAKAAALEQSGKLADAEAALLSVLPATPPGGSSWEHRGFLEPQDAEWAAAVALARMAVAHRSAEVSPLPILVRVAGVLWGRRSVADRDTEALIWMSQCEPGAECSDALKTAGERVEYFSHDSETGEPLRKATDAAGTKRTEGRKLALELIANALGETKGTPTGDVVAELTEQSHMAEHWPKLLDEAPALIASFDKDWGPYVARRRLVAPAVADAAALEKAGKLAEARARLEAVITASAPDADGKLARAPRHWIEVRDAELEAVEALERVLQHAGEWRAYIGLTSALWVRRPAGDADSALCSHILRGGKEDYDGHEGKEAAVAFWGAFDEAGLVNGTEELTAQPTKGGWMALTINTTNWQTKAKVITVAERKIHMTKTIDGNDRICKTTNQIDRYNDDGSVHYKENCTYKPRKDTFSADVTLAEPAPAWARAADGEFIHVLGKVIAGGGRWQLKDAIVLDLRYFDAK